MPDPSALPPLPPGAVLDAPPPAVPSPAVPKAPGIPEGYEPDPARPGALRPQIGGPKDPTSPQNSLTPDALNDATSRLILTGQMDPMGMSGGPVRIAILNNRPVMMGKYNITDQQLPAIRSMFDADSKAYSQRTQQLSFQNQALLAAQGHVAQITSDLKNLPAQSDFVPANAVSNFVQGQFSGRTITDLNAEIPLLEAEFGKIMTGNPSTGAGNLTDAARKEFDTLRSNASPDARIEAMQKIMQMGQAKLAADQQAQADLGKKIGGGIASYANMGGAAPGSTNTKPGPTSPPGGSGGSGGGPNGATPNIGVTTSGGFADSQTSLPSGATDYADAIHGAIAGGQAKDHASLVAFAQKWNQDHGTDFSLPLQDAGETAAFKAAAKGQAFGVSPPTMNATEASRATQRIKDSQGKADAAVTGAADSVTLGGIKSLTALGDATTDALSGKGFDYTGNLNAATNYIDAVRANHHGYYLGGQLAGGLALPGFGARTVPEFARLGTAYGGIYGFNESAGQPLVNRALDAGTGAITGAAVPYGISYLGKGLNAIRGATGAISAYLPKAASAVSDIDPAAIAAAGQAERVGVNRAMVDPSAANKVSAVDRSMVGGPIFQRGMNQVKGQIEQGVSNLAPDGTPLEPVVAGASVADAANRYIKTTGADFTNKYGALNSSVQGMKFTPAQANLEVEQLINKLSETPNINAKEISFLQGLHQDLSNGLSINALRALRTKINGDIASGDLTFGPDEARVKGIADAAATDISNGLQVAGKSDIAQRFQQVDGDYRQRMQFINGTLQDLIGKRGDNLSGEQVYGRLKAMIGAKGDSQGLTNFLAQMTPQERSNVQATFADALGKDNKGNFSTAILANQVNAMPPAMRTALFGNAGAESLGNLGTLANAHNAVASKMSGSPTGPANDYRSWLNMLLFGGGEGIAAGEGSGKAMAAVAAAAALKGGRDIMNARMLLNKDISNWIKNVPSGSVQGAMDVHMARLNAIAAKNPALASDIGRLKQAMQSAANTNTPFTGSAAASPNGGPNQQQ